MLPSRVSTHAGRLLEPSVNATDVARALRSSLAMATAWTICILTGHPMLAAIVAPTAQNVALLDVRGDYKSRLAILLTLTAVIGFSVFVGTLTGNNILAATLSIGLLAILAGCYRHLSGDYGPHFALGSGLLFFIAISQPGDWHHALNLVSFTALAGLIGILFQLSTWFVRPQHALRHAAAEAWVAASDLITAMRAEDDQNRPALQNIAEKEGELRATVDRALLVLEMAITRRNPDFIKHLDAITQLAARLATRTTAFYTALEPLKSQPDFARVAPTLDSVLRTLANTSSAAGLTIIMHRPEQLTTLEVRLRRATDLMRVLDQRLRDMDVTGTDVAQARQLLSHLVELLGVIRTSLTETVDHSAANYHFALRLPELSARSIRSLSSWLNPPAQTDWLLVRYTLRVSAVLMLAVAAYLAFEIPRGYWIPFTAMVVLQPDYGATRLKAGQRVLGTLAGSVLGSLLLWVRLPVGYHIFFASIMAFGFAFFLKRNYSLAVFLVTLMIVLMTEVMMPVNLYFTMERLLSTLAGATLALIAAFLFWPKWEQAQSPHILASALRANRKYFEAVVDHLKRGEPFTGPTVLAKREAERANSLAVVSLQRLLNEPARLKNDTEQTAALTTCNQRLTRAITVLGQHLNSRVPFAQPAISTLAVSIGDSMESLAGHLETGRPLSSVAHPEVQVPLNAPAEETLIYSQLSKISTEIEAMLVENKNAADEGVDS